MHACVCVHICVHVCVSLCKCVYGACARLSRVSKCHVL